VGLGVVSELNRMTSPLIYFKFIDSSERLFMFIFC